VMLKRKEAIYREYLRDHSRGGRSEAGTAWPD